MATNYLKIITETDTQCVITFTHPKGEFDIETAYDFGETFYTWVSTKPKHLKIVLDMQTIAYIDSEGVWQLCDMHKKLKEDGRAFAVTHVKSDMVKRVFDALRLHKYLEII